MRDAVTSGAVREVRAALRREARDLELLTHRVRRLLAHLPAPATRDEAEDIAEGDGQDDPEAPDEASELRAILQCVLVDLLEPVVRQLQAASRGRFPSTGGGLH
jgi:hypothetical protein